MRGPHVEMVSDQRTICGEAPTWDADRHRVLWVDNEQSLVFEHSLAQNRTVLVSRDLAACGLALNGDGRLAVGALYRVGVEICGKPEHQLNWDL